MPEDLVPTNHLPAGDPTPGHPDNNPAELPAPPEQLPTSPDPTPVFHETETPTFVEPSPAPMEVKTDPDTDPQSSCTQVHPGEAEEEEPEPEVPEPTTAAVSAPVVAPELGEEQAPAPSNKHWYVVKVQSGREETIKAAIERRVRKEGLEEYFGQIVIPVEQITEVKPDRSGKRVTKTKSRKLYPGYIMAEVEYNDRILYLFRETSGVGDFVGASADRDKPPPPMTDREIQRILGPKEPGGGEGKPPPKPKRLDTGVRVRVTDGTFAGMEGEVKEILESVGHVKVELTIFGRPVPVELEYFQIEEV
jgi:transcriptional antiterminator NusG